MASSPNSELYLLCTILLSASQIYTAAARYINLPMPSPQYSWAHAFPYCRSLIDRTARGDEILHAGRMYRSSQIGATITCMLSGAVISGFYDVSLLERALVISRETQQSYWHMMPYRPVQSLVSSSLALP